MKQSAVSSGRRALACAHHRHHHSYDPLYKGDPVSCAAVSLTAVATL